MIWKTIWKSFNVIGVADPLETGAYSHKISLSTGYTKTYIWYNRTTFFSQKRKRHYCYKTIGTWRRIWSDFIEVLVSSFFYSNHLYNRLTLYLWNRIWEIHIESKIRFVIDKLPNRGVLSENFIFRPTHDTIKYNFLKK